MEYSPQLGFQPIYISNVTHTNQKDLVDEVTLENFIV